MNEVAAGPVVRPPWLRRHRLLWIARLHHDAVIADIPDRSLRSIVADWLAADWPLVVRQQSTGQACLGASEPVAVGMPLPLALGRRRIALMVASRSIAGSAPPPLLRDVIARVPQSRRAALLQLAKRTDSIGLTVRVYGSMAWEALTGCTYLTPHSDIDLLWRPSTPKQLATAIAMLARWEADSGVRADGEILFGDDDAVPWREWMREARRSDDDHSARVLVKAASGPRLESPDRLLARLSTCETEQCSAI
jgi:phosphoribosyl-dephospho-CoA transferase